MRAVRARKDKVVLIDSREGLEKWLRDLNRCTFFTGHARFESDRTVRVGELALTAERIFVNVGARPLVPNFAGIGIAHLTSSSILDIDFIPKHLIIVGGSYVGLEFAQMYRRFGSEVTVIEREQRLLWREDTDVCESIESIFDREGIAVRTAAECIRLGKRNGNIVVGVDCQVGAREIAGSHVLLAVGRKPNTDDLGLDRVPIGTDQRGYIIVDDKLQTDVPGIWAIGDCNGKGAFTHTAYNDFQIVADNLLDGAARRVSDRIPCYALYIDPPLGRVGMTETQARAGQRPIRVAKRPMTRVARAVEKGQTQGFMKVVVDAQNGEILGAAILGVGGDEAIHGILDTMAAKAPFTVLEHAMHIHPTVSELIPTMLGELLPQPLRMT